MLQCSCGMSFRPGNSTLNGTMVLKGPLYQLGNYIKCLHGLKEQYCLVKLHMEKDNASSSFWLQVQVTTHEYILFVNIYNYTLDIEDCTIVPGEKFLKCFSVINNFRRLSSRSKTEDSKQLRCIQGIRVLSILTPAYALMIAIGCSWFVHFGEGPMWFEFVIKETKDCQHHWWINLLYLNNYFYVDEPCLLHTWYLAADFQNYIVTLLVLITINHLAQDRTYQRSYITFHNNAGSYFMGAIFGYVYYNTRLTGVKHKKIIAKTLDSAALFRFINTR
ncbi:hypothetical protein C0J52_03149 [Blattella germanica]|nr:hypothetical protein C0J52_03149 [Blattella germanica]